MTLMNILPKRPAGVAVAGDGLSLECGLCRRRRSRAPKAGKLPAWAVLCGLMWAVLWMPLPIRAQCALPAPPGQGVPAATFDQLVMQNGPGWTGADSTYSLLLPNGQNLWMWSDSYIGTVNPDTRLRSSSLFQAHNSLTVWDQAANTWTTVGYPASSTSYFKPKSSKDWFWVGDGIVIQPSPGVYQIKQVLLEWTGFFKFLGNSVATLSWPSLSVKSIQAISLPNTSIEWGAQIFQDSDGYYYLYGIKDPGTANKLPYLARFRSITQITQPSKWTYWKTSTNSWVSTQSDAEPLTGIPAITGEYSVSKLSTSAGSFYLMVGADTQNPPYPNWKYITTYYSCTPQGPWTNRTVVYTTPETGKPGCKYGNLLIYNPHAHPEFNANGQVLISYNVNDTVSSDLVCANDYIPRFIQVAIQGLQ